MVEKQYIISRYISNKTNIMHHIKNELSAYLTGQAFIFHTRHTRIRIIYITNAAYNNIL